MVDPSAASEGLDIKEVWKALMRRRRIVVAATGVALLITALYTAKQRLFNAQYAGGFQLLIADPVSDQSSGGGAGAGAGGASFGALALNNTNRFDLPTLLGVLQSPLLLDEIARRYGRAPAGLSVTPAGAEGRGQVAGILNVGITGTDPRSDQRLLQGVAEVYLAYSLNQRQQRLTEGLRFLDKQAPALEAKLSAIQAEVAAFRQRYNLLNPEEDATALKTELLSGEQQLLSLATERQRLLQASRSIANGSLTARGFQEAIGGGGGGSSGSSGGSGGFTLSDSSQNLLSQLDKADQQLAEARSRFAESSPMVRGLQARRTRLLPLLRNAQMEALRAALASNANRTSAAQRQQQRLAAAFRQQPILIKSYDNLQQRLEIAKTNLAGLLQTRENFQVEIAQNTVPWKVIAPPRMNPTPVSPSVPKNMAAGLLLGLAAGSGLALLRDRLDHVFHSPAEVKDDLDQPLLGHIPHVAFFQGVREDKRFLLEELDQSVAIGTDSGADQQRLTGYQRFFYQEAFRNLSTSLRFLNSDQPLRSVALTSSMPAEGKSLVNVLLAKTLSEMGQRVLLVDADLRKPQMHHRLGLNNLSGLSNLLTEDDLDWRRVLQPVRSYEGWSVITAGRRPPDPTRLLSSARMHQLVADLATSGQYDLVLYDTPPVLGLADAALVAQHLDGLMLLVSLDRVDRGLPKEAAARIQSSGASLLGVVTNAVKSEESRSMGAYGYGIGKYGYGKYGYGYGYGYGAYDPRSTYAYYQNDDTPAPAAETPSPQHELPEVANRILKRVNTASQRLLRWIDG